jgi:hypothetical protein
MRMYISISLDTLSKLMSKLIAMPMSKLSNVRDIIISLRCAQAGVPALQSN